MFANTDNTVLFGRKKLWVVCQGGLRAWTMPDVAKAEYFPEICKGRSRFRSKLDHLEVVGQEKKIEGLSAATSQPAPPGTAH